MKKDNPMFVSTTNGAYDFIDFTTPSEQKTVNSSLSTNHLQTFGSDLNHQSSEPNFLSGMSSPDRDQVNALDQGGYR